MTRKRARRKTIKIVAEVAVELVAVMVLAVAMEAAAVVVAAEA